MWTLEVATRRRYVHGMAGLSVWYVRQLWRRGELMAEDVPGALCERVNLYRLTDLWDGRDPAATGVGDPAWQAVAGQLAEWICAVPPEGEAALEGQAIDLLQPLLEARVAKDVGPPPVRTFECWTYELGWTGLASRPGLLGKLRNREHLTAFLRSRVGLRAKPSRHGVLHFMNVLVPESPLEDLPRLARTLQALLGELRSRQPQVRELWCNTWLNDHPRFREVFPEAWFQSATVAPPGHFRNWWGQFARRDGDFNAGTARRFRESGGVFPFRALQCHASLEAIEGHLKRRFG